MGGEDRGADAALDSYVPEPVREDRPSVPMPVEDVCLDHWSRHGCHGPDRARIVKVGEEVALIGFGADKKTTGTGSRCSASAGRGQGGRHVGLLLRGVDRTTSSAEWCAKEWQHPAADRV